MDNLIVPSAIQRIRSFLVEMSGMKVKPWATTEETLAALHTTLVARHACQIFWTSLRGLLETLARDLKVRQEASPGSLVDNELLDSERYATLLDEIRAVLARQSAEPATFRRLATALSAPALGLLLFLGGAASVGCDGAGLRGPAQARDAGQPDASITVTLPDAASATAPVDAQVAPPPSAPDGAIILVLPDTRPPTDAVAPSQSDGATVTIQDIMQACNIPDQQQSQVMGCLSTMRASWTTGIVGLLAGADCYSVAVDLRYCSTPNTCNPAMAGGEFDGKMPAICLPIVIYAGVRFV